MLISVLAILGASFIMEERQIFIMMSTEISTRLVHSESPRLVRGDWAGMGKSPPYPWLICEGTSFPQGQYAVREPDRPLSRINETATPR
jgi:hypothetical protein